MRCQSKYTPRQNGMAVLAVLGFMLLIGIIVAFAGTHANELGKRIDIVEKQQINRMTKAAAFAMEKGKP